MEDAGGGGKEKRKKIQDQRRLQFHEIYFVHKSSTECFRLFGPFLTRVWTEIMKICWDKYFFSLKTGKAAHGDGDVLTQ